jgi:hypothetical protein
MTRREALYAALLAFLMVAGGLTWQYGWYGVSGSGAVVLVALPFMTIREDDDDDGEP